MTGVPSQIPTVWVGRVRSASGNVLRGKYLYVRVFLEQDTKHSKTTGIANKVNLAVRMSRKGTALSIKPRQIGQNGLYKIPLHKLKQDRTYQMELKVSLAGQGDDAERPGSGITALDYHYPQTMVRRFIARGRAVARSSSRGSRKAPLFFELVVRTTGIWYSTGYKDTKHITPLGPVQPIPLSGPDKGFWYDVKNHHALKYNPHTPTGFRKYDSSDETVIKWHLRMLAKAKIDFLIFDLTNNIDVQFVLERALAVCDQLIHWNQSNPNQKIFYAAAIGWTQYVGLSQPPYPAVTMQPVGGWDPNHHKKTTILEYEAGKVLEYFVRHPIRGQAYFRWNGKPLLIANDQGVRAMFEAEPVNTQGPSASFTMKWWEGQARRNNIPKHRRGDYLGWAFVDGTLQNDEAMVVMPGWKNDAGASPIVSRNSSGQEAFLYKESWRRVITTKPKMVVINSFNEFTENTAVEPSDTTLLGLKTDDNRGLEKWSSRSLYWNLTRKNNLQYKTTRRDF